MAISRGGRYTVDNVVPACAACNASKCNDEVTGWMRRKRLDERSFLERYVQIRAALTVDVGWPAWPANLKWRAAALDPMPDRGCVD